MSAAGKKPLTLSPLLSSSLSPGGGKRGRGVGVGVFVWIMKTR